MAEHNCDVIEGLEREWRDALCSKDMDRLRALALLLFLARLASVFVVVILLREHRRGAAGGKQDAENGDGQSLVGADTAHGASPAWAQPDWRRCMQLAALRMNRRLRFRVQTAKVKLAHPAVQPGRQPVQLRPFAPANPARHDPHVARSQSMP